MDELEDGALGRVGEVVADVGPETALQLVLLSLGDGFFCVGGGYDNGKSAVGSKQMRGGFEELL